jgi:hypothetical protein
LSESRTTLAWPCREAGRVMVRDLGEAAHRVDAVVGRRVVHPHLGEAGIVLFGISASFGDDTGPGALSGTFQLVAQGSNGDVTHTTGTENRGRWRQAGGACLRLATCAQVR